MKTTIFDRVLRRWFLKQYIRRTIRRTEADHRKRVREAQSSLTADEVWNLRNELNLDLFALIEWEQNVEDRELIARANKLDIDLQEITRPEPEEFQKPGIWKVGSQGSEILYDESRREIKKAVRELMPVYRKERRDAVEFYIKIITLIVTVMTGLIGAATGLVALLTVKK